MSSLSTFARKLGLGRLAYALYYFPRNFVRKILRRGVYASIEDERAHRSMRSAALDLKPLPDNGEPVYTVCFLTGEKYWHQTLLCAYSLQSVVDESLRVQIFDDGTLRTEQQEQLRSVLPHVEIESSASILARLDAYLPVERYPSLRARREEYPHLRKLTDVHAGGHGWKLVLDSDMLFYRAPTELIEWLQSPTMMLHMEDCETSYGYSPELLTELAGTVLPERVNVGVCGLKSDTLDWDELERWCQTMIEREGTHYVQEQALIALLAAQSDAHCLPASQYVCDPQESEVKTPSAALHHYVAESKSWYYRYGWQHVVTAHEA